jgi:RNA polymerase sigma factor for flagellar operon FliA
MNDTTAIVLATALYETHADIARRIANRYSGQTGTLLGGEDLLAAAQAALYNAALSFDPARGSFVTHAWRRVKGAVVDAIRRQTPGLRDQVEARRTIRQAEDTLAARHARPPRAAEIAEELGLDPPALAAMRERAQATHTVSLDEPLAPTGIEITLHDLLAADSASDPCADITRAEQQSVVERAVDALPPQQRQVVTRVLLEGATGRAVAAELCLTPGRVSQILAGAKRELRKNPELREMAQAA